MQFGGKYMRGTTTDLKEIAKGVPYAWGDIVHIHEIGDYNIVESVNRKGEKQFHAYSLRKDCNHSYDCLEAAIVGAIAYKYDGINSRAEEYFMKMIGIWN
jgi:hypothetical protein